MSITYQIQPVIDTIRAFIDVQLIAIGAPAQVLPTLTTIAQYPFDSALCPLLVLEPVSTSADWRQFAVGDVMLSLDLQLHEIRLHSGAAGGEETIAIHQLCALASAFAIDYRLGGDVQNVLVESISLAEPDTLHRLGIPTDEQALFAAATMKIRVIWVESCFATA
jgi:hypothetical protein